MTDIEQKVLDQTNEHIETVRSYLNKIADELKRRADCHDDSKLKDPEWPIFLDPSGQDFVLDERKNIIKPGAPKGVRVDLKIGDMLIYSGCELEHWREPFEGNICSQVFLHYNHANGPFAKTNLLDGRPLLGVPK